MNFPSTRCFVVLLILTSFPHRLPARRIPVDDAEPKSEDDGITVANLQQHGFAKFSELKKHLHHFGYMPPQPGSGSGSNFTDEFDSELESAIATYQTRLGLRVTRRLDTSTLSSLSSPRCGVPDDHHARPTKLFHVTRHYTFFDGMPRWDRPSPMTLTYGFSPLHMYDKLGSDVVRTAFARAFATWAKVIPMQFEESSDYETADVRIGFYLGDHGDGEPFDGVLGVLGHSFSPEDGRLHLDGAETWSVDFKSEQEPKAVDLESVATHEIGHILGLGHSSDKEAVMYPVLNPRTTKVDLVLDDVEGVQTLYGSNPNFTFSSLSRKSETASSLAAGRRVPAIELAAAVPALVLALLGL